MYYIHGHNYVCHTLCQQDSTPPTPTPTAEPGRPTNNDFDNCKQLDPSLSLAWTVNKTSESVQFMLCGCTASDTAQWVVSSLLSLSSLTYQCPPSCLSHPSPTSVLPHFSLTPHLPVSSLISLSPLTYQCPPSFLSHPSPTSVLPHFALSPYLHVPAALPTETTHGWGLVWVAALVGLRCLVRMSPSCGWMMKMELRQSTTTSQLTLRSVKSTDRDHFQYLASMTCPQAPLPTACNYSGVQRSSLIR